MSFIDLIETGRIGWGTWTLIRDIINPLTSKIIFDFQCLKVHPVGNFEVRNAQSQGSRLS